MLFQVVDAVFHKLEVWFVEFPFFRCAAMITERADGSDKNKSIRF